MSVAGSWKLGENQGVLTIDDDLETATFEACLTDDHVDLHLTSRKGSNPLVYEGDSYSWDFCRTDFDVKLEVSFDSSNPDRLPVEIDVSAVNEPGYGRKIGGFYSVIGTRR